TEPGMASAWAPYSAAARSGRDTVLHSLEAADRRAVHHAPRKGMDTYGAKAMNAETRITVPDEVQSRAVGFVIIGRNEGERLECCIRSVLQAAEIAVYVDSGSADGSSALARRLGLPVVDLDPSTPFTAARARNAGAAWLAEHRPALEYLHF